MTKRDWTPSGGAFLVRAVLSSALLIAGMVVAPAVAAAQNAASMAPTLRVAEPTIHSIGFEWDLLSGDANHNARCDVRYRAAGTGQWKTAQFLRIDFQGWYGRRCCMDDPPCCTASPSLDCSSSTGNPANINGYSNCSAVTCCQDVPFDIQETDAQAYQRFNMFAGSLMFLAPGTTYDVELTVTDPDGPYAQHQSVTVTTRAIPKLGTPSHTYHVIPGSDGGTGTMGDPFQGLAAANAVAQPGDLFLLHPGGYTSTTPGTQGHKTPDPEGHDTTVFRLTTSGSPGQYIAWKAWKAVGDEKVTLHSELEVEADHIWIEGLHFEPVEGIRGGYGGIWAASAPGGDPSDDLVIVHNTFHNLDAGVTNTAVYWDAAHPGIGPDDLNKQWYVCDNVMYGELQTYGVYVHGLRASDICYNRLENTVDGHPNGNEGDAVSLKNSTNVDLYGNDIRNVGDDAFEPDNAYANIRIWRNRSINAGATFLSFQPMYSGPWYVIRNEVVGAPRVLGGYDGSVLYKANVYDRIVQVNNTFVVKNKYFQHHADIFLRSFSRNNLFIHEYHTDGHANAAMLAGNGNETANHKNEVGGQSVADWNTDVDYDGFDWDAALDNPGRCIDSAHYPPYPSPFNAFWWSVDPVFHWTTTYNDLSCFFPAVGIEGHARRVHRANEFSQDIDTYPNTPFSAARLTLQATAESINRGVVVPNLAEDYLGAAPDLGAYEYGAPLPHYGPRTCGDGVVDPDEGCDDGNRRSGDGCSVECQVEACHTCSGTPSTCNAVTDGTTCDDGNACTQSDQCTAGACAGTPASCAPCDDKNPCTKPRCGNGIVDQGEQCDDGNTLNGDCCSATCQNESALNCANGVPQTCCSRLRRAICKVLHLRCAVQAPRAATATRSMETAATRTTR